MVLLENNNPKVLLVDSKSENIISLIDMLDAQYLDFYVALNAKDLFKLLQKYSFDLILLDVVLPDMDGYEICKKLKKSPETKDIPLIFISSLNGIEDKLKGFDYGGDDFISKPLLQKELIARVKLHLQKGLLLKSLKQLLRKSYHELYNPLAIINTSIEMQNLTSGANKYTDSITIASRTLQVVYDDLYYSLASQNQQQDKITIDLSEFVQKRIDYFHYFKKSKNILIDFQKEKDCKVEMQESDLLRIIDNTLSNAIKYAQVDSTITIFVTQTEDFTIFKSINIGIEIKDTKKIFQRGHREDYQNIGMGIGLEIVAFICHQYNILINVISQNGFTIFEYKIPKI